MKCRHNHSVASSDTNELLSITIVTHNSQTVLGDCLQSLASQTPDPAPLIIIIDSGSDTTEYIYAALAAWNGSWLVREHENVGYGTALNSGLMIVETPWMVGINPDVSISAGDLHDLCKSAEARQLSAAAPRLVDGNGLPYAHDGRSLVPPWRRRPPTDAATDDELTPARMLPGAVLAMRARDVRAIGGFDSGFFLYAEEDDLAARLLRAGHQIAFVETIIGTHRAESGSGYVEAGWRKAQRIRGRVRLIAKHWGPVDSLVYLARDSLRVCVTSDFSTIKSFARNLLRDPRPGFQNGLTFWPREILTNFTDPGPDGA